MNKFIALGIFLILATSVFAQEGPQDRKELGAKIAESFKDKTVVVETTYYLENGEVLHSQGSGVFVDKEGHIATVAHVVKEEDDVYVRSGWTGTQKIKILKYEYHVVLSSKKRKYMAELVGDVVQADRAVLKANSIDPKDYSAAKIGDPDKLKKGDLLFAMGTPRGQRDSFTHGVVSNVHCFVNYWYLEDFIQTDCPINPGNSGCPLINSDGEVVALADLHVPLADGMAWGVSMKVFKIEQLKKGDVELPWFGAEALIDNFDRMSNPDTVFIQDLTKLHELTGIYDVESLKILAKLTLPTFPERECWAIVTMVEETKVSGKYSPAKLAGLKRGDLVTKVNDKPIKGGMELRLMVAQSHPDEVLELEVLRIEKGVVKQITIKVTLQKKEDKK